MTIGGVQGITSHLAVAGLPTAVPVHPTSSPYRHLLDFPTASAALRGIECHRADPSEKARVGKIQAWVETHGGTRPMTKVLIANRGDPAIRMIRAIREFNAANRLDIKIAVVYPPCDAQELYVRMADEAIPLNFKEKPNLAFEDDDLLVEITRQIGASHVYPGWGFRSEKHEFATAMEQAGIVFIGPTPEQIEDMGHKVNGLESAEKVGLPVGRYTKAFSLSKEDLKNSTSTKIDTIIDTIIEPALHIARTEFDFPQRAIMLKDPKGGGGTGNTKIDPLGPERDSQKCDAEFRSAMKTFLMAGKEVFIEGFLGGEDKEVQHIEFQVLGDGQGNAVCLGWRQCSIQRRDQKVVEMTHTNVPLELLEGIQGQIVTWMRAKKWRGPGTCEFLIVRDKTTGRHSGKFMEMNTRLQVEHGITEESYRVDIVQEMLRITMGLPLSLKQEEVRQRAVTIEVRICAEDEKFNPQVGKLYTVDGAGGPGVRTDLAVARGSVVLQKFDSMVMKLMVTVPLGHLSDDSYRDLAVRRAALDKAYQLAVGKVRASLREVRTGPVLSNKHLVLDFVETDEFARGDFCLGTFVAFAKDRAGKKRDKFDAALGAAVIKAYMRYLKELRDRLISPTSLLSEADLIPPSGAQFNVVWNAESFRVTVAEERPGEMKIEVDGKALPISFTHVNDNVYALHIDAKPFDTLIHYEGDRYKIDVGDVFYRFTISRGELQDRPRFVASPVTGRFWLNHVKGGNDPPSLKYPERDVTIGDVVKKGQILGVVVSMKMELPVEADRDGRIVWVNPKYAAVNGQSDEEKWESISEGTPLYRIEPLVAATAIPEEKAAIPFAEAHHPSLLERLRKAIEPEGVSLLEDLFQGAEFWLPQILSDLRHYFLGYDFPEPYIESLTQVLDRIGREKKTVIRGCETELVELLNVYWHLEKMRSPDLWDLYYRFLKGAGRGQHPMEEPEFRAHLMKTLRYYGLEIDPETVNWSDLGKTTIGNTLLRIRLADRNRTLRRAMMETVLESVAHIQTQPMSDALFRIIDLEKKYSLDPSLRKVAEAALEQVDVGRYRQIHQPPVDQLYADRFASLCEDPRKSVPSAELAMMQASLNAQKDMSTFSEVPQGVLEIVKGYCHANNVSVQRIYAPFTKTFAFRVLDPSPRYLVIGYNEDREQIPADAEVLELPRLQLAAVNAAHTMHLLQGQERLKGSSIYIVQNQQYPIPFDPTGEKKGEVSPNTILAMGKGIFGFFERTDSDVVAVLPEPNGQKRAFVYRTSQAGLHLSTENLTDHLGPKDEKTARQRARGLMIPEERAEAFFGKGNYEELLYSIDEGGPVGVKVYRGSIDGLPVMVFANDFRVAGGSFGEKVGRILARAKFQAYMEQIPVFGLMDGAGANIKEGLVALNYSAEDFMLNVITGGDAPPEMFSRWIVNHPDRKLIKELLQDYGPGGSLDGATLLGDRRFQDLVSKVESACLAGAIQVGAGVGMVVYGSSLLPIQTMVDLPAIYRILTGSRVRRIALGETVSDYDTGGALVHAVRNGEVMALFPTEQEAYSHARRLIKLLHPKARQWTGKIGRAPRDEKEKGTPGLFRTADLAALVDKGSFEPYKELFRGGEAVSTGIGSVAGLPVALMASKTEIGFGTYQAIFKARELMRSAESLQIPVIRFVHGHWLDTAATERSRALNERRRLHSLMARMKVPQMSIATSLVATRHDGAHFSSDIKFFVNTERIRDEDLESVKGMNFEIVSSLEEAMDRIAQLLPFFQKATEEDIRRRLAEDSPDRPTTKAAEVIPAEMDKPYDVRDVIRDVADGGRFVEIWADMNHPMRGPSLVVGFAFIGGKPRLVIADQPMIRSGAADHMSAEKDQWVMELAERLGLCILRLNDAPGFDPQQVEEFENIQGAGAGSINHNIQKTVPTVRINLRKGYGGRLIQANHPFLRPGTVELVVEGSEIAVMGPAGKVAALDHKRLAKGEKLSDLVQETRTAHYGDPHKAVETGVADAVIPKTELRGRIIEAFEKAERLAGIAFRMPHNIMTAPELNLAAAMQRLEVLGFQARAVVGVGETVVEVHDPEDLDWRITLTSGEVLRLLRDYPQADRAQIAHLIKKHPNSESRQGIAKARQMVSSLLSIFGIGHKIEDDRLFLVGGRYYFDNLTDLFGYLAPSESLERVLGFVRESGLGMERVIPLIDSENAKVYPFSVVDSTNNVAKAIAAKGAVDGSVVVAEGQTAGRGRTGKAWHSPRGGLWFSLIHRGTFNPAQDIPKVNIAAALAVCELIQEEFNLDAKVAWPNDVMVKDKKIAGILNEPLPEGGGIISGIGLNLNILAEGMPTAVEKPATSVQIETGRQFDRDRLIPPLQQKLQRYLRMDRDEILRLYQQRAQWPQGRIVTVSEIGGEKKIMKGQVVGIDFQSGMLLVELSHGGRVALEAGLYHIQ